MNEDIAVLISDYWLKNVTVNLSHLIVFSPYEFWPFVHTKTAIITNNGLFRGEGGLCSGGESINNLNFGLFLLFYVLVEQTEG